MMLEPVNSPDQPTDSLDENISLKVFFLSDKQIDRQTDRQTDTRDRQTDRQTDKACTNKDQIKLKTFRHWQLKSCMRLMDIAADVASSLKFKLNDLTSFSSHIMTLKHMVAAVEP